MKVTILILIFISLNWSKVYAQCCPYINSVFIYPSNPNPSDSIYVVSSVTTPNLGTFVGSETEDNGDTITIQSCFFPGIATQPKTFIDTVNLGLKAEGVYTLEFLGYSTSAIDSCIVVDTNMTSIEFEVFASTSLKEIDIDASYLIFPNPVVKDIFTIQSFVPLTYLELTDSYGRIIQSQHIENKLKLNVSVKNVESGTYFARLFFADGRTSAHQILISKE